MMHTSCREEVYTDIIISGHAIYENQTVKHRWCLYKIREQELPYVGVTRLELATTRPPDAYANQLRHTPIPFKKQMQRYIFFFI